jgi:uncharacterized protein (DUF1778 family)
MNTTQISATVSNETKILIENYSHKSGVKKSFLIEDALLHHLQALKELPQDLIIPIRIELTDSSMQQLLDHLDAEPTPELTALMQFSQSFNGEISCK